MHWGGQTLYDDQLIRREGHWTTRGSAHYPALLTGYQGLCNLASLFSTKTCVTKLWISNRDWLRRLYRWYHVSHRVLLRDSVDTHRKSTIPTSLNAVPSYIVMMCGWQSVDMISISLRMWTRSCSSLIFSFLIDFMATLKKRKKEKGYIWLLEKKIRQYQKS